MLEPPTGKHLLEQFAGDIIGIVRDEDVVPRSERLKYGRGSCHAGGKRGRPGASLEGGEALLHGAPIWIGVPPIYVAGGEAAILAALEGGGQVNRRCYRAGRRIRSVAGVYGQGLEVHTGQNKGESVARYLTSHTTATTEPTVIIAMTSSTPARS